MDFLPESISRLIDELGMLPGIGPKSAQRLAFHILKQSDSSNMLLGDAISKVKEGVVSCEVCFSLSGKSPCKICSNEHRDHSVICVVETTLDLIAIEKTREFRGLYHVLGGKISPLDGVGPDDIRVRELFERLDKVNEVILALNPDLEGDTTALFLHKKLSGFAPLQVSRIARGIPSGGNLEYTDDVTLVRALQGRQML